MMPSSASEPPRHLLSLSDLGRDGLIEALSLSARCKRERGAHSAQLAGRIIALLMELPSTRTQLSFQVAVTELGGHCVNIESRSSQLGRGEPIEDFARVCSRMFAAIVIRSLSHQRIASLAAASSVPVLNALSSEGHPCQALADLLTLKERFGRLEGLRIAWLGDGNNVCASWIEAAGLLGLELRVSTPAAHAPEAQGLPDGVRLYPDDPHAAVADADVLMTDVWSSMGNDGLSEAQKAAFAPFQINQRLLERARNNPVVMHCMPIHRGEEISADVIDDPRSLIFEQAANRLHTHKALLMMLLGAA